MKRRRRPSIAAAIAAAFLATLAATSVRADAAADAAYAKAFAAHYPPVHPVPTLAEYATVARYDASFLGADLDRALKRVHNQRGAMAWGLSYRMVSLNEMARATGDAKYLAANLRCIRASLAARDDVTGRALFDGRVAPAWSSDGYRPGEQALFLVHTGMIVYPMLDAVHAARSLPNVPQSLRHGLDETVARSLESIAAHDGGWRDGPGEGEGHYVMLGEEPRGEGKPQPGNRLSAMGRALWAAHRVTKDEGYRTRALAIGRYLRRRLPVTETGAYVWPYWLAEQPLATTRPTKVPVAEDTSHASLTMAFPLMLAEDGEVFTRDDVARFGKTVEQGFARLEDGVLLGLIDGSPDPARVRYLGHPANWLQLTPFTPTVRDRIVPFYLRRVPAPQPSELAYLIRYAAEAP